MKFKALALGIAAAATLAAPIGFSAAAAERASARAVAPAEEGSELASGSVLLLVLGAAAAIGTIVAISGDDDEPVSA